MSRWLLLWMLVVLVPSMAWADDTKDQLRARAEALIERADTLRTESDLPLEGRRAIDACDEWIAEAEEARKRRNFAQAATAQRNADLELDIAQAYLRAARLAVTKRELEAVVRELSSQVGSGEGER